MSRNFPAIHIEPSLDDRHKPSFCHGYVTPGQDITFTTKDCSGEVTFPPGLIKITAKTQGNKLRLENNDKQAVSIFKPNNESDWPAGRYEMTFKADSGSSEETETNRKICIQVCASPAKKSTESIYHFQGRGGGKLAFAIRFRYKFKSGQRIPKEIRIMREQFTTAHFIWNGHKDDSDAWKFDKDESDSKNATVYDTPYSHESNVYYCWARDVHLKVGSELESGGTEHVQILLEGNDDIGGEFPDIDSSIY